MTGEIAEARKLGWPLTAQDIIQERVEFEDRFMHRHTVVEYDPKVMSKERPTQTWTPPARYVFGNNLIRFAESLIA